MRHIKDNVKGLIRVPDWLLLKLKQLSFKLPVRICSEKHMSFIQFAMPSKQFPNNSPARPRSAGTMGCSGRTSVHL